jgi:hypothetical protein
MMVDGDPIAFLKSCRPGSYSCDDSRRLVTQRERRTGHQIPLHGIGYADPTGFGLDKNPARFRIGNRSVFYLDVMIVVIDGYFHFFSEDTGR